MMFAKGLRRARSATVGMLLAYAREVRARAIGVEDIEDAVLGFFLFDVRPTGRPHTRSNSNEACKF